MFEDIARCYTIAFTVRSGSNAICDLLTRNGLGARLNGSKSRPPLKTTNHGWTPLSGLSTSVRRKARSAPK
jgi:hypothetical protein